MTDTRTRSKGGDEEKSEGVTKTEDGGTEIGKVPIYHRYGRLLSIY